MKKYLGCVLIVIIPILVIFTFLYYFGHNDAKKIAEFLLAYRNYDKVIIEYFSFIFSIPREGLPANTKLELEVDKALAELDLKAAARISSLTRNDGDLMKVMLEIAAISGEEVDHLKAYQTASISVNTDLDQLMQEFNELSTKRQADYAHYLELAELNP